MGHLTLVAFLTVLFGLFVEAEANSFVYNYESLRIGGLVFAILLISAGIGFLLYGKCKKRGKHTDNSSEI
uniref:FXYD domain-containing ion transport regulator n=3 Tax=Haplochromini TaxID=319058 RepID=A0A3P9BGM5_9CICH